MKFTDLINKIPNKGSNGRRSLRSVVFAIVHHDGIEAPENYSSLARYTSQAEYHLTRPRSFGRRYAYHVRISRDGEVFLVNPFEEITYHAGNWDKNKRGIGICLDGNLSKQQPTAEQVKSLWELLDYLTTKRPDMPHLLRNTIKTHREVRWRPTSCPSKKIQKIVEAFRL